MINLSWIQSHKRELFIVIGLLLAFVVIRLPGLSLPYHQDEWKTAEIVRSHIVGGLAAHPPLTERIYRWGGDVIGADNLRVIPLTFGVLSAALLYLVVRRRSGMYAAIAALSLYSVCMYGVWASLMVDTDGAILPSLFLLAVYVYDRCRRAATTRESYAWVCVAALVITLGLLTKLSAVLILGALAADYLIEVRHRLTRRVFVRALIGILGCGAIAITAIVSAHFFLPSFDVSKMVAHVLYYVRFEGRGYLQILIQAVKALFYLSPLLIVPLVFISRETFKRYRIFVIYLGLGAFFYFVLFDFSQGALDKYLMFSIVPLAAIVGDILTRVLADIPRVRVMQGLSLGGILAAILVSINFLSPQVVPLYPKTEWISAVAHGNWNILMPFTGGSGPLGFYVSFLFIAVSFATAGCMALGALIFPKIRPALLVAVMVVGLTGSAVFIEELLWGRINGSAPKVLAESVAYIASSEIKSVITHADTGAYELNSLGKYAGRFYAVLGNESVHRERFAQHKGHYLVVDFPQLNMSGFYSRFFATCESVFDTSSGAIEAHVYYCPASDPYSIPNYASQ